LTGKEKFGHIFPDVAVAFGRDEAELEPSKHLPAPKAKTEVV
jgi:hypothetical protein